MQSFGEERVSIESFSPGMVRVLGIYADGALYPRLVVRLGWVLRDLQPTGAGGSYQTTGFTDYRMVDLAGELRIGEGTGPIVGRLWPTQSLVDVRSSAGHSEDQVQIACDLDFARLEKIEEMRKGQPARFSLVLWPTIIRAGTRVYAHINPLTFQIPRDTWVEFLGSVRFGEYEILELRRLTHALEGFAEVREQLELARLRIHHGEYNVAVAAVRTALERVIQDVRGGGPPLKDLLAGATDDARGELYAGIVTKLKELCNRAVHKPDATVNFTRPEASYILRTAESAIVLLGQLLPERQT